MTIVQKIEPQGCGCDAPEQLSKLISIDAALARIIHHAAPVVGNETMPLMQAVGRVLAAPVLASAMTPPFDNAAMDGYAVATGDFTGDGPWRFAVAARVPAGWSEATPVGSDGVARIFTGAPIPPGADAVIRQEDAQRDGDMVTFAKRPEPGLNIRRAGTDMRPGQVILEAGARLGPREIAACAAAGAGHVELRRKLRVALLVTGDEVRRAGTGRQEAEIWDVNTPMLCAAMVQADMELVNIAQVADTRAALELALSGLAGRVDLIVTTGGVSVGEEDHVKPALAALGGTLHFSGVAIKPGKPVSFGALGCTHWLGLPGNPLAALLTWQVFGTALVRRLTGQCASGPARRHVVTENAIHRKPGRCELRPATLLGFDDQGREIAGCDSATHSGRVGTLPLADGVLLLPAECDHLPKGALVEFLPFPDA
ncbi:molybdopterin molybdotransferase MoeA [Primorskyibacter aestuariivivens]|uniref:molybdopterin molybdotransferase MoeA n=1 Tax=Primorskyibacter aestuariivivens TaxID=1888912 RepID=UPI002300E8D7|nr:gephyrin-like molybdotransferase Glp [Primorskyibacter aestuariivivens]MDA7430008.1 molybdopterin molybdotransferase MoeA [Primorskyibacter aestuariivivens]